MNTPAHETFSIGLEGTVMGLRATQDDERPPKLTQQEAAFLLGRGQYVGRLAGKKKLLAYAESIATAADEYGPDLPAYVREELVRAVEIAEAELVEYDSTEPEISTNTVTTEREVLRDPVSTEDLKRSLGERSIDQTGRQLFLVTKKQPTDWRERSLCAQTDPEAFHPEKGGSTREAKKVCQNCEVREECLQWALDNDERYGIWGGMSERERRKLKKRAV